MPLQKKGFLMPLLGAAMFALVAVSGGFANAADPGQVVAVFHETLLKLMKTAGKTPVRNRYEQLEPAIVKAFNLSFMIRVAVGPRWKKMSDADKETLAEAFKRMSVGTYASRFDGYSGQSFKTLEIKEVPRNSKLVKTHIASPGDKPVKLTYVMRQFGADWNIVDVLLDGSISEMAVRVSEYREILRRQGGGALAATLNQKANRLISP